MPNLRVAALAPPLHQAWDRFVESHDGAGIYHTLAWQRVTEEGLAIGRLRSRPSTRAERFRAYCRSSRCAASRWTRVSAGCVAYHEGQLVYGLLSFYSKDA